MKILSFRVTINNQIKLSNSQIHKMVSSSYYKKAWDVGGFGGFCIVDYNTGKCLEVADNPNGVKVSEAGWKTATKKIYKDNHGCTIYLYTVYDDVTVRYYHGNDIAVGIFGHKSLFYDAGDSKFWNGKAPFVLADNAKSRFTPFGTVTMNGRQTEVSEWMAF